MPRVHPDQYARAHEAYEKLSLILARQIPTRADEHIPDEALAKVVEARGALNMALHLMDKARWAEGKET